MTSHTNTGFEIDRQPICGAHRTLVRCVQPESQIGHIESQHAVRFRAVVAIKPHLDCAPAHPFHVPSDAEQLQQTEDARCLWGLMDGDWCSRMLCRIIHLLLAAGLTPQHTCDPIMCLSSVPPPPCLTFIILVLVTRSLTITTINHLPH